MSNSYFTKSFAAIIFIFSMTHVSAQDKNVLLKQAKDLELKFDEAGALEKYKQIVQVDPTDITAIVKCAEFNCSIGEMHVMQWLWLWQKKQRLKMITKNF
jgi:hypothetical protein